VTVLKGSLASKDSALQEAQQQLQQLQGLLQQLEAGAPAGPRSSEGHLLLLSTADK
jgi:hypothetical protein